MGGRQQDPVWKHAKKNENPSTKEKKPYVDLYEGKEHSDNATKFKLYLAFNSPGFRSSKAYEWCSLVASLTESNVKSCKEEDKSTWRQCVKAKTQRTDGAAGSGEAADSHLPSALARAGAFGGSVLASGLAAARLHLQQHGTKFMDKFVDSISAPELEALKALQLRWILRKGLPLSACDGELFEEFLEALRPACKGKLLNYDKIRCGVWVSCWVVPLLGCRPGRLGNTTWRPGD